MNASAEARARILQNPADFGLSPQALAELISEAADSKSDALMVAKDSVIIAASSPTALQKRFPLRSVTKSIVSLAIGSLIAGGVIKSIDEPLTSFFPDLRGGKRALQLHHLLTHTTGLSPRGPVTNEWSAEHYLRTSRRRFPPATHFSYSDASTELLADIIERASGRPLDELAEATLFRPLAIHSWNWERRADGTPHAAFGLELSAESLLRLGQMVASGGQWGSQRVLAKWWTDLLFQPGSIITPHYSLLWYLRGAKIVYTQSGAKRRELEEGGLTSLAQLREFDDRTFSLDTYWREVRSRLPSSEARELLHRYDEGTSPLTARLVEGQGLYAHGWLGQHLAIYPHHCLVAVRLRFGANEGEGRRSRSSFPEFLSMLEKAIDLRI